MGEENKKNGERTKGDPPSHTIKFAPEGDERPWKHIFWVGCRGLMAFQPSKGGV